MLDPIDAIRQFVEGTFSPCAFRDALYGDDRFEMVLSDDPDLPTAHYVRQDGGTYYFLLAQDFEDPGGVLNAHGALCEFLDRKGISYAKSNQFSDFYNLVLEAAPNWLDPNHKFVAEHIMPDAPDIPRPELRQWLSQRLLERFLCANQPPDWIQSPSWPVNADGPLVFLGQVEIPHYFHDLAAAYVFYDPKSGKCETIIQCH